MRVALAVPARMVMLPGRLSPSIFGSSRVSVPVAALAAAAVYTSLTCVWLIKAPCCFNEVGRTRETLSAG